MVVRAATNPANDVAEEVLESPVSPGLWPFTPSLRSAAYCKVNRTCT